MLFNLFLGLKSPALICNLGIFKYALREENAILFDHKTRRWAKTTKKAKEGVEFANAVNSKPMVKEYMNAGLGKY